MTATEGTPALPAADPAAPAGDHSPAAWPARSRAPRLRMVLALARVEAALLVRSLLVVAGVLAGGAVVWLVIGGKEPLWWNVGWRIGAGQLVIAMAVLAAAQLAAGRPRRNAMTDLYASFPATSATRMLAHLAGLAGALPASLLLIGAAVAVVQTRGPIGTPDIAVLAGGVLLVIAAGAAGIAVGARFSHPLAGVLAALVLLISSGQSHLPWAAGMWLYPWESFSDQLSSLPGPLAGYPPAAAHAEELAGLAVLAGIVALALTVSRSRTRARGWLPAAGIIVVAVICFSGSVQVRPIPTTELNHLVNEVTDPASAQHCATANHVRYCLYPGFGSLLPSVEAPVNAVLARLPAWPAQPLTVRQVVYFSLPDPTLTHGHPNREVSQWNARLQRAPGNLSITPATAIYLPVGNWPATGGQLADAHFDLALATAEWAVRLPGTSGSLSTSGGMPCVPLDQAREAVAIWLAILATHPPAGELQDGLGVGTTISAVVVGNTAIRAWAYPGVGGGYVTPPGGGPQTTAAGYLLASEMTGLPQHKVSHILSAGWARWLDWQTTDAQLAAALGLRMPSVSTLPTPANGPQAPLCTA